MTVTDGGGVTDRLADGTESRLRAAKQLGGLIVREARTGRSVDLPAHERLRLWRNGFLSEAGALFDLPDGNTDRYLSNYERDVKTIAINGPSGRVLDDKLLFHHLLSPAFDRHLPRLYYYLTPEGAHPIDAAVDERDPLSAAASAGRSLVVKPRTGGGGDGVTVLEPVELAGTTVEELAANGTGDRLLCECVEQGRYADAIYPGSVNTIRVLTMIDPRTSEPFVARAVHRFGTEASAPLDNWSRGGVSARVDAETGQMGPCASRTDEGEPVWTDRHPETGERVAGRSVPNWARVVDALTDVAASYPALPYVGWDVVVDEDPGVTIIEGNRYSDVNMLQTHGPLLDDPRVRRFYEHHGIR
ncbi:sugar-transfer associated ATP-grasp domain-containing protein [Halovivax gelatinilyticus]|uniref:sugar-transfer associated ATP-grasp domain-containing protein n=1 Tax=Halovivax gelatinilyticus TaxID=2961597 RepID=UPI0020CA5617|nr:sugar-transfer associated ATP-grasp domain-containing protein [Halovivax gelatinilyticus]